MKKLFGDSWKTTLAGYGLSAFIAVKTLTDAGETHWFNFVFAVGIAILGKQAGDSSQVKETKTDLQATKYDNYLK